MKTFIAVFTLIASALVASPALAGSVNDFTGNGFRKTHGSSHTVSTLDTVRHYSENGSFSGQQSQTNVDYAGPRGDMKSTWGDNNFGIWAEGTSKFVVQQSSSELNYDFAENLTQTGHSRAVATEGFVTIDNGYVIDANIGY